MLSMLTRLKCEHSYATEDSPHLLCDFDGACDGKLYIDQFFVGEDGCIVLADDCGNIAYVDMKRFKVVVTE